MPCRLQMMAHFVRLRYVHYIVVYRLYPNGPVDRRAREIVDAPLSTEKARENQAPVYVVYVVLSYRSNTHDLYVM